MVTIRVSEFAKDSFTRQRLLFTDDIIDAMRGLLQDWNNDQNPYYAVLKYSGYEVALDDSNLYKVTFDYESNCSDLVEAAKRCRKALIRGLSKAGFVCIETEPLSFEGVDTDSAFRVNDALLKWAKSIEIQKRTLKTMFANSRGLRFALLFLALLLIAALILLALRGCPQATLSQNVKKSISESEFNNQIKNDSFIGKFDAIDDVDSVRVETPQSIFILNNDRGLEGKKIEDLSVSTPHNGTVAVKDDSSHPGRKYVLYSSNPDFIGDDSFSYTVKVRNSANEIEEDSAVVNLIVSEDGKSSQDLLIAVDDHFYCYDCKKTFCINVLKNDIYPYNSAVALKIISDPIHGKANETPDNRIFYTPEEGYQGKDTFEYSIQLEDRVSKARVYIIIESYDNTMRAENDYAETAKGESVKIRVLDNDVYKGKMPAVTIADVQKPKHGKVSVDAENVVTYTPDPDYVGNDSFKYSIEGTPFGNAVVSIAITDKNVGSENGIAKNDEYEVIAGKPAVLYPLDNDVRPSSSQNEFKIYGIEAPEELGGDPNCRTCFTDGTRVYYKAGVTSSGEYYTGRDVIFYYIGPEDKTDGWPEGVQKGCIVINVRPASDDDSTPSVPDDDVPPELPDSYHTLFLSPGEKGVVTLDEGLEPQIVKQPTLGYAVPENNTITYRANDSTGVDSFTYKTAKGMGKVEVKIGAFKAFPLPDRITTPCNQATNVPVLINDLPKDENNEVVGVSVPSNGFAVINENKKTVRYEPYPEFLGWDVFTYRSSAAPEQDVTVQVYVYDKSKPELPKDKIACDDNVVTEINQPVRVYVLKNDMPIEDELQISEITVKPQNGSANIENDCIVYTPKENFCGYDYFEYSIGDSPLSKGLVSVSVGNEKRGTNVAHNDVFFTYQNVSKLVPVLINDQRIGTAPLNISVQPKFGSAEVVGDKIRYTPNKDFIGRDYFIYYIGSEENELSSAIVCMNVLAKRGAGPIPGIPRRTVPPFPPFNIGQLTPPGGVTPPDIETPPGIDTPPGGFTPPSLRVIKKFPNGATISEKETPEGYDYFIYDGIDKIYSVLDGIVRSLNDLTTVTDNTGEGFEIDKAGNIRPIKTKPTDDKTPPDIAEIAKEKASNLILVLDDTRDVYNALPKLNSLIKEYLEKKENKTAHVSCIVFDDKKCTAIFDQEINSDNLQVLDEIKTTLRGLDEWDKDGKVKNYEQALINAASIFNSDKDNSQIYFISDGDSSIIYNEAMINGLVKIPPVKVKSYNLSSKRDNRNE